MPTKISPIELIRNFDQLPDDGLVPDAVARLILNESERSFRRNSTLRKVQLGPGRHGRRVGDIRALVRGEKFQQPHITSEIITVCEVDFAPDEIAPDVKTTRA